VTTIDVGGEKRASADWKPVDQDRAGAAHLQLAAELGPGETESVTEELGKCDAWLDGPDHGLAVHDGTHVQFRHHVASRLESAFWT
jgi:hypothetical protein